MTDTVNVPRDVIERAVVMAKAIMKAEPIYGCVGYHGDEEIYGRVEEASDLACLVLDEMAEPAPKAEPVSDPYKLEPLLWSMHVLGPDDVYPAPDLETAFKWCEYVNTQLAPRTPDVLCAAIPALWDGTPEQHAKSLPDAIKGWTAPAHPEAPKVEQEPVAWRYRPKNDPIRWTEWTTRRWEERSHLIEECAYPPHPAPASDELLEALEAILDLGSDGEHSGDRHAKCRSIARAAIAKHKGPQS